MQSLPKLYHLGTRNFLFMNALPVARTPYGHPAQGPAAKYINARFLDKAIKFQCYLSHTNVFQPGTHSSFNTVIHRP